MNKEIAVSELITEVVRDKFARLEELKKEVRQLEKDLNKEVKPALRKIANGEELEFSNDDIEIKVSETKEIVSVKPKATLEVILSDKQKKKGLTIGSFDYTNTSKPINSLLKNNHESVKEIGNIYDSVREDKNLPLEKRKKLVESHYRPRVKKAGYDFLNSLSSDDIIDLIGQYLIEPNKKMEMFITDCKENKRYTFPFINHPIIKHIKNGFTASIRVKDGRESGQIIFSKSGEEIKDGLRIRVHLNNGPTALLNAGNSNNSSQFVLKFQQDNIKKLLTTMGVSAIEI